MKNEGFKEEHMPRYEITKFFSNSGSRNEVRMRVVDALAAETPGTGNGEDASNTFIM